MEASMEPRRPGRERAVARRGKLAGWSGGGLAGSSPWGGPG
eukprot:CAMPEP_0194562184 /NCGR_PEP_ID=MMETSP0292-20121207/2701_1 /TAXON_ID=39354 /ORGANISM="Heterosigma akashiwo, Strain CCMP2393" /LENGTH=40 /DNA_ID= /DNA_START= /DNA_END= /DNA_ORIENTATION=